MAETSEAPVEKTESKEMSQEAKESAKESAMETVEAVNLLAQGKRNMLCGEIPQAVTQLQDACRKLAAKYGETSDQVGEAYLCYGTALLEMSRMESGVLGNALQGIDEEDAENSADDSADDQVENPEKVSEEEREKIGEQVIDAMTEEREAAAKAVNGTAKMNGHSEPKENGDAKPKENGDAQPKENGHAEVNGHSEKADVKMDDKEKDTKDKEVDKEKEADKDKKDDETSESKDGDTEEEEEAELDDGEQSEDLEEEGETKEGEEAAACSADDDPKEGTSKETPSEDEVSNLQLAWEMLELAKIIFSRTNTKQMKLKVADAYMRLGEVGLETEQYEQAIGDFRQCLKIQKEYLEPESRLIAETFYQIGLACCFNGSYEESIQSYKDAVSVIETKIANVKKVIADAEEVAKVKEVSCFDDPIPEAKKELKDLEDLLPDILAKIEDTDDERKSQDKVKQLVKENVVADMVGVSTVGFGEQSTSTEPSTSSTTASSSKASDITHLVRKKRKPEEDAPKEEDSAKKPRQEADGAENGSGDKVNGGTEKDVNGAKSPEIKVKKVEDVKGEEKMDETPA